LGALTNITSGGVYRDSSNIVMDVYKYLCFTLYFMQRKGVQTTFDVVKYLLLYFNQDAYPNAVIEEERKGFFGLLLTERNSTFDLDDFIDFCRRFCTLNGLKDPVHESLTGNTLPILPIVDCDKGQCPPITTYLKDMGLDLSSNVPIPKTFFEFFDDNTMLNKMYQAIRGLTNMYNEDDIKEAEENVREYANNFQKEIPNENRTYLQRAFDNEIEHIIKQTLPNLPYHFDPVPIKQIPLIKGSQHIDWDKLRKNNSLVDEIVNDLYATARYFENYKEYALETQTIIPYVLELYKADPTKNKDNYVEKLNARQLNELKYVNEQAPAYLKTVLKLQKWIEEGKNLFRNALKNGEMGEIIETFGFDIQQLFFNTWYMISQNYPF
jgi:hypothetical protein